MIKEEIFAAVSDEDDNREKCLTIIDSDDKKEQLERVKEWIKPKYALTYYWEELGKGPVYPKTRNHGDGPEECSWENTSDGEKENYDDYVWQPLEDDIDLFMPLIKLQRKKFEEFI